MKKLGEKIADNLTTITAKQNKELFFVCLLRIHIYVKN